jgi:lysozyme family protein
VPDYRDAINKVLQHEGGYVNNPADRGGPTNFGVTQKTYSDFIGHQASIDEIKNMPIGNAITIYKKNYWDVIQGDKIKQYAIAAAIFDQAINRGHVAAVKQAQRVLGLSQDGKMGPVTLAAINATPDTSFIPKYISESITAYKTIVANNPSQAVFLNGWLKRAESLRQYAMGFLGSVNATTVGIGVVVVAMVGVGGFFLYQYLTTPRMA